MSAPSILLLAAAAAALLLPAATRAEVRITEFMSEGQGLTGPGTGANRQREFFELTNLGGAAIDVSAWTYNDNNINDPIAFGAAVGMLQASESIVLTQMAVADFISYWQLPTSVRVFSFGSLSNLGNADTVNIYNSATQDGSSLVDSLTYTADLRGSGISRNRPFGMTGAIANAMWVDSALGDVYGSRLAPNPIFPPGPEYIDLANPGVFAPVPEPAGWMLMAAGLAGLAARARRR
jgi:hypothetical protein